MSRLPVDIVSFNEDFEYDLETAITIANAIQDQFTFNKVEKAITQKFKLIHFEENDCDEFLESAIEIKRDLAGYYPYMLFVSQNPLNSVDWSNLFANHFSEHGVGVITTNNVPDIIIPKDKIKAYFVYYFARTLLKFLFVGQYNHENPSKNGCVFDFMREKKDIIKSMRANAICDNCRKEIRKHEKKLSEVQYQALDRLLEKSGSLLKDDLPTESGDSHVRIFIGSSKEALPIARKIKSGLKYDAHVDTWADGIFDEPGKAYIEVLEEMLNNYEYGIFVFNPDDKIFSRGKKLSIPRDNVIFEYGMFLGKHTRKKAFFIVPRGLDIKIMTDVLGITCLDYDPTNPNLQSAVSDACDQIRDLISKRKSK